MPFDPKRGAAFVEDVKKYMQWQSDANVLSSMYNMGIGRVEESKSHFNPLLFLSQILRLRICLLRLIYGVAWTIFSSRLPTTNLTINLSSTLLSRTSLYLPRMGIYPFYHALLCHSCLWAMSP